MQCVFQPLGRFSNLIDYFTELFSYFARPEAWTLYPDVVETLSVLQRRGLALDVISNFDSRLIGILEGLGAAIGSRIFLSQAASVMQNPRGRFFTMALERHNLAAGEASTSAIAKKRICTVPTRPG